MLMAGSKALEGWIDNFFYTKWACSDHALGLCEETLQIWYSEGRQLRAPREKRRLFGTSKISHLPIRIAQTKAHNSRQVQCSDSYLVRKARQCIHHRHHYKSDELVLDLERNNLDSESHIDLVQHTRSNWFLQLGFRNCRLGGVLEEFETHEH